MEYFLIGRHKYCIEKLNNYDVIGILYSKLPPHFSGNFWWSTGRHYRMLSKELFNTEQYILSRKGTHILNLYHNGKLGHGNYMIEQNPEVYIDKQISEYSIII